MVAGLIRCKSQEDMVSAICASVQSALADGWKFRPSQALERVLSHRLIGRDTEHRAALVLRCDQPDLHCVESGLGAAG